MLKLVKLIFKKFKEMDGPLKYNTKLLIQSYARKIVFLTMHYTWKAV